MKRCHCGAAKDPAAPACVACLEKLPRLLRVRLVLTYLEAVASWERPVPPPPPRGRPLARCTGA